MVIINSINASQLSILRKSLAVFNKQLLLSFGTHTHKFASKNDVSYYGIKWNKPESVPSWKPEKSCDLNKYVKPDKSLPISKVSSCSEELSMVDDVTRRLLSLEFGSKKESIKRAKLKMMKRVQHHVLDTGSKQAAIAALTCSILSSQACLVEQTRPSKFMRIKLQENITRRKKLLRRTQKTDYKAFEWILDQLNIVYKPDIENFERPHRKPSLRKLVQLHCDEIIESRLNEYKNQLDSEKADFLEEKAKTLKWIEEAEKKLSEVN